ncbi:MAG: GNAT family N-acetyltransferase [Dehalococcoidia bacterium]|nr:GNAT family N-acetyltransferase [Dehalococcoidia bacterium]
MTAAPVLEGHGVRLRPLTAADQPALLAILRDPTVARWWGEYDEARVRADFSDPEEVVFLVEVDDALAGIIEYGEELDPYYHSAGIDIALTEGYQSRGIGPAAVRLLARYLFEERGHHRLTIDPAADNRNAIRAYERVGFRPVGIMRQYERGADGTWHDALLMDMLAGELR